MSRATRAIGWILAMTFLVGTGMACVSKASRERDTAPAPSPAGEPEPAREGPPSPALSAAGCLDRLKTWAPRLPVGVRWVALFPASDLKSLLVPLPEWLPRVVMAPDGTVLRDRIRRLWGIEAMSLYGDCVVFEVAGKGVAGLCEGAILDPPAGARWQDGVGSGPLFSRWGREIRVGRLGAGGPVALGDATAVSEVLAVARSQVPSLAPVVERRWKEFEDLAGSDPFRRAALWVLDPEATPFGGKSSTILVLVGDEGYLSIFRAAEGQEEALWNEVRTWWATAAAAVRQVTGADPENAGQPGALGEFFKAADTPLRGEVSLRGDRVFLRGPGNPLWSVLAVRQDLLARWVGGKETSPEPETVP